MATGFRNQPGRSLLQLLIMNSPSHPGIASLSFPRQGAGEPLMNAPAYPVQIFTLATWLSLVVAGVMGILLQPQARVMGAMVGEPDGLIAAELFAADLSASGVESEEAEPADELPSDLVIAEPPEMPERLVTGPLPELPKLALFVPRPAATGPVLAQSGPTGPVASESRVSERPRSVGRSAGTAGVSGRMSQGTMPAPRYPSEARRRGQEGTVVVEFTVAEDGRVVSVAAKQPSPWPLLNQEAMRAVQSWKFPPGEVMKMQRPIIFQLR